MSRCKHRRLYSSYTSANTMELRCRDCDALVRGPKEVVLVDLLPVPTFVEVDPSSNERE